jgi:hypothetical protein
MLLGCCGNIDRSRRKPLEHPQPSAFQPLRQPIRNVVADLDPFAPLVRMPVAQNQAYRIEIGRNMLGVPLAILPNLLDIVTTSSLVQRCRDLTVSICTAARDGVA